MSPLTQRHRAQQLLLRKDTIAKVVRVWPTLDFNALDDTYPMLASRVLPLIQANRRTSSGLSARYVRDLRRSEGIPGSPSVSLAEAVNRDQFATSLRVTSVVSVKSATARGLASDLAMEHAATATANAMARLVLNGGRETVLRTIRADGAQYSRVLGGDGCDFCQMLADRGAVYSSESADFEAHDKCACTPQPDWG